MRETYRKIFERRTKTKGRLVIVDATPNEAETRALVGSSLYAVWTELRTVISKRMKRRALRF